MSSDALRPGALDGWQPRPRPERATLEGRYCRLEPLEPARHGETLFEASMAPDAQARFRYLFESPQDRRDFGAWLERAASSEDPLYYGVVVDGRCEGRQAFMRITPEHGVIEIGSILWGPAIARTRVATEAFALFARHAFEALGYRRLEWKCNALNAPSRRAAERFGFTPEGVFRQHMVQKGQNRDTAWYSMLDGEWRTLRRAYEGWLAPENFEGDGRQRQPLAPFLDAARAADG